MEADELLMMEFEENEQRKDFTLEERLAFRDKIAAVERNVPESAWAIGEVKVDQVWAIAHPEMKRRKQATANCPKGKARDLIGKSGLWQRPHMKRVDDIAENRPDLLEAIDQKDLHQPRPRYRNWPGLRR